MISKKIFIIGIFTLLKHCNFQKMERNYTLGVRKEFLLVMILRIIVLIFYLDLVTLLIQ